MKRPIRDTTLSDGLADLRREVQTLIPGTVFASAFDHHLRLLQNYALSIENELAVHRIGEDNAKRRTTADDTTLQVLREMVEDPEGKVIRPDFGGRP